MKGKENKQTPNRPILLTGVQIKSHMISDSAGHVARSWSGLPTGRKSQCVTAQRAFLSPLFIFFFCPLPLFSCTVNVLLSGQVHEESPKDGYRLFLHFWKQGQLLGDAFWLRLRGTKSRFQLCLPSLFCHQLHGCRYKMITKACYIKKKKKEEERGREGGRKKIQGGKKQRLLILWKTSKAKSHFSALLFSFPLIFFLSFFSSFLRVREQLREVTENTQTMKTVRSWENSPEEGGKGGFKIKERDLRFAKSSSISQVCQQNNELFLVLRPSPTKRFTKPGGAHKVLSSGGCYPRCLRKSRVPWAPAGKGPWAGSRGLEAARHPPAAAKAVSARALGREGPCQQIWRGGSLYKHQAVFQLAVSLAMAGFTSLLQGTGCVHRDFLPLRHSGVPTAVQTERKDAISPLFIV